MDFFKRVENLTLLEGAYANTFLSDTRLLEIRLFPFSARVRLAWLAKRLLCSFALGKRLDRFLGKLGGLLLLKLEQSTKGKKHINWYLHVSSQLPFVPMEWQTRLFLPECCSRLSLLKSVELLFRRARFQNNEVQNRWDWGETRKDFRGLRLLFFAAYNFASPVYHYSQSKYFSSHIPVLAFF